MFNLVKLVFLLHIRHFVYAETNSTDSTLQVLPPRFGRILTDYQSKVDQVVEFKAETDSRILVLEAENQEFRKMVSNLNKTFYVNDEERAKQQNELIQTVNTTCQESNKFHVETINKKLNDNEFQIDNKFKPIANNVQKLDKKIDNKVKSVITIVENLDIKIDNKFKTVTTNAENLDKKIDNQLKTMTTNVENLDTKISEQIEILSTTLKHEAQITELQEKLKSLEEKLSELGSVQVNIGRSKDSYDCCTLRKQGFKKTRNYQIKLNNTNTILTVRCDMETEGGGWTIIQRRTLEGLDVNFTNKGWVDYEEGFGLVPQSYWIGLKNIAEFTKNLDQEIRFDMEAFASSKGKHFAKYGHFYVTGPEDKYRLSIGNYSGTAGCDSMFYSNGRQFTTIDNDNDAHSENCAVNKKNGWWHKHCTNAQPNGILYTTEIYGRLSMYWYDFHDINSLKFMEMKIRNKNPTVCGI